MLYGSPAHRGWGLSLPVDKALGETLVGVDAAVAQERPPLVDGRTPRQVDVSKENAPPASRQPPSPLARLQKFSVFFVCLPLGGWGTIAIFAADKKR